MKKLIEVFGSGVNWGIFLLVALLTSLVGVSNAQASFPTSENPAKGEWRKMHPGSFPATIASAVEQCYRVVKADPTGRLTAEKCEQFATQLKVGFCEKRMAPDGIVHDFMNQRVGGKSTLLHNVVKRTGRTDQALLCDLGDGVFASWYSGVKDESCENVGITYTKVPVVPVPEREKVPVEKVAEPELKPEPERFMMPPIVVQAEPPTKVCRFVKTQVTQQPVALTRVPDLVSCGCVFPGYTGIVPGGPQTSSVLVCE
jgi:hypothetical protein